MAKQMRTENYYFGFITMRVFTPNLTKLLFRNDLVLISATIRKLAVLKIKIIKNHTVTTSWQLMIYPSRLIQLLCSFAFFVK